MFDSVVKMMSGGAGQRGPQIGPQIRQPEPVSQPSFMQQALEIQTPVVRKEMKPPSFGFHQFGGGDFGSTLQNLLPQQTNLKTEVMTPEIRDDESERLSDIPSDLESPPPSDFGSPEKTIEVEKTVKKTRGRAAKKTPRIIEI